MELCREAQQRRCLQLDLALRYSLPLDQHAIRAVVPLSALVLSSKRRRLFLQ